MVRQVLASHGAGAFSTSAGFELLTPIKLTGMCFVIHEHRGVHSTPPALKHAALTSLMYADAGELCVLFVDRVLRDCFIGGGKRAKW